jgi:hypothetical protein
MSRSGVSRAADATASGAVQCWGDARQGQMGGREDLNQREAPVEVPGLP